MADFVELTDTKCWKQPEPFSKHTASKQKAIIAQALVYQFSKNIPSRSARGGRQSSSLRWCGQTRSLPTRAWLQRRSTSGLQTPRRDNTQHFNKGSEAIRDGTTYFSKEVKQSNLPLIPQAFNYKVNINLHKLIVSAIYACGVKRPCILGEHFVYFFCRQ